MSKGTKVWLVTAALLVVVGLILFAVVLAQYGWDFSQLSTKKFQTNTYTITEDFTGISMHTDTADILFATAPDGVCQVMCYEQADMPHKVEVENGALTIDIADNRAWYEYIGIQFDTPKITVYLPETSYASLSIDEDTGDIAIGKDFAFESVDISLSTGDVAFSASVSKLLKIQTSTGHIRVEDTQAGAMDLAASTGGITVAHVQCEGNIQSRVSTGKTVFLDVTCKQLTSTGDTGDLSLKTVNVAEKLTANRSTGDVKFDNTDAAEVCIVTDTGDVTGRFLTDKVFIVQTDTGDIDVPKTGTGGKCEITTDTGDIRIKEP